MDEVGSIGLFAVASDLHACTSQNDRSQNGRFSYNRVITHMKFHTARGYYDRQIPYP
jgi:hypothetical protein